MSSAKPTASSVALVSFLVDISDILLNLMVAILSGSVIMTTQWLQGIADFTSSGLILYGVKQSKRRANKKHPFGYGRELYFWTLLSTTIMFTVTAGLSFYLGWRRLLFPEQITDIPLAVSVLFIGVLSNLYSTRLNWRRLRSQAPDSSFLDILLHSSVIESRTNLILDASGAFASVIGLVSLFAYQFSGNLRLDGLGTIVIAIFMAIFSVILLLSLRGLITGQSVDAATQKKITEVIESFPEILAVLDLRTSILGPEKILVNAEVHAQPQLTTPQLEQLMDQIKHKTKRSLPELVHMQIELETPKST